MIRTVVIAKKKKKRSCIYPLIQDLSGLDLYTEAKSINVQIHADSIWMETFCSVMYPGSHRDWSETLFRTTLQMTLYIEADYTNKVFAE